MFHNRLDVLRGIIADITNTSKVDSLITSDGQIFPILRRRLKLSSQAMSSSVAAGRSDITQKEKAQCAILQEYIDNAGVPKEEEIQSVVAETVQKLQNDGERLHMGSVMRALLKHGGPLWGKPLEVKEITRVVRLRLLYLHQQSKELFQVVGLYLRYKQPEIRLRLLIND